jgi:hypothetical protein
MIFSVSSQNGLIECIDNLMFSNTNIIKPRVDIPTDKKPSLVTQHFSCSKIIKIRRWQTELSRNSQQKTGREYSFPTGPKHPNQLVPTLILNRFQC